jgi:hypothetical protein
MALNSLFNDILTFALIKTNEGMVYYWEQAHKCRDLTKKLFLLYLSVKKLQTLTFLKKVIKEVNSTILSKEEFADMFHYLNIYNEELPDYSLEKVRAIASENAIKELEFFQLLKIPRKTNRQNAIMDKLISHLDLFFEDIESGYEKLIYHSPNHRSSSGEQNTSNIRNYYRTYA